MNLMVNAAQAMNSKGVHGIIERHGGEIRVETRIDVGTTFVVELPLTKPATAETILDEETEGAFA
jgi:light-regulated signal transduction histidine kinase (bacteriophytochrome)